MFRSPIVVLGLLLFSASAFGQANPSDSQNLQAVLAELRQLRQDFETTTVATQRIQILLYRLQGQEAAVARASRRLDDADAEQVRATYPLRVANIDPASAGCRSGGAQSKGQSYARSGCAHGFVRSANASMELAN